VPKFVRRVPTVRTADLSPVSNRRKIRREPYVALCRLLCGLCPPSVRDCRFVDRPLTQPLTRRNPPFLMAGA
jgi:hypothetical protein